MLNAEEEGLRLICVEITSKINSLEVPDQINVLQRRAFRLFDNSKTMTQCDPNLYMLTFFGKICEDYFGSIIKLLSIIKTVSPNV